ncbi:uncharacterized protein MYCFIDRAFT_213383 [Pseudocercospora fijiensis CIRAD86]|uniref:EF-hand domain-containing protein n=1 Tax=Pseudocercospora fijiensis (strain CIRAD86) TaxID=383855 RepID=N1QBV1_PSEFD|nr:uncharacterized protein MYCFIDRAFT_213383 [Pseudocercospora fijiensis CIRAD86]EME88708.1 hypothetical protein MYCFIDRAFT_213383 [Pseudocercospora fijiensis CIRAD86]
MAPSDVTIDIPLEPVKTSASSGGGLRNHSAQNVGLQPINTNSQSSEKKSWIRGRRTKPVEGQGTGRVGYDGEEDTLTTMGKIYDKILGFSIITRYFLYVLPLGLLIAVPIIVGSFYSEKNMPEIGGVSLVWFFTWVEIVWLSLWVSKIVVHFLPFVFQTLVGVVSSGVRKYATVLRKLEIPLSLVGWAVTSLATFKPLMEKNPYNRKTAHNLSASNTKWVTIVQEILGAAVVSTLVFLAEKFIIQLISINYHRKQFNARIKDSKRQVYILGLLYDASTALFPAYGDEFQEEDYAIADQLNFAAFGGKRKRTHKRSGSATPMRALQELGRLGDKVTSAFGNVASEITGKEVFNPNSSHSIVVEALERRRTSEALARRIWMSMVMEGHEELREEDIVDVLGPDRKAEAEEAYEALDRDGNGDISLDEMIQTVVEWGRERKAIATSMVDVAQAINVLDRLLQTVVLVAVVFIFIAFLNKNFVTTLATTGTALLSLSFVFSVTAQEILGSCIFLFVKHPFDVGDRVDIADNAFLVEHISLLFTVFRRANGNKTGQLCQYPNIVLNTLALDNISRSKAQTEQITLDISFDTKFDDIQILRNELVRFVTDKDNSRDFLPDLDVEVLGTSDMSKLQLKVEIRHKSNWANETLRAARRSKFMCALVAALRAVPIYAPGGGGDAAGSAANPNYSVAITDSEAKENAQHTADEREKARLVATKKIQEAKEATAMGMTGMKSGDAKVINDLNSRDPAIDTARDQAWASGRDDNSTLGERPSIDQQDLNDVRSLLRRESTRGKRKASTEQSRPYAPGVPTINEPHQTTSAPPQVQFPGSEARQPSPNQFPNFPSPYRPTQQYQSAQGYVQPRSNVEMSQIPQQGTSNPYRSRGQEQALSPPSARRVGERDDEDDAWNGRPYSGV